MRANETLNIGKRVCLWHTAQPDYKRPHQPFYYCTAHLKALVVVVLKRRFSPQQLTQKTTRAVSSPGEIRTLVGGSKARYA